MKKLILLILIISIIFTAAPSRAANSYITLKPYPYSSHVLGEDLIIYGETDFSNITIGLFYPYENGYNGISKYIMNITDDELEKGYVIKTDLKSRPWPEGKWKVRVQYGDVYDEIYINMSETAHFDQHLRIAEYENNTLTSLTSYYTRGVSFSDNILSFTTENGDEVKIFSWNNLSPVNKGESRIYITVFSNGFLKSIRTYQGTLSFFGKHISLKTHDNKTVKLFYWNENMNPTE